MIENIKKEYIPCSITLLVVTEFHSTEKICAESNPANSFNDDLVMEW